MPAFRGGHVLYNGLMKFLYSRCGDRAYRNCRRGGCPSAVYPRDEKERERLAPQILKPTEELSEVK